MSEQSEQLRRLRWQCRRGLLELDLLFLRFLDERYMNLSAIDQHAFQKLLEQSDTQLLGWIQQQHTPPDELKNIIRKIV